MVPEDNTDDDTEEADEDDTSSFSDLLARIGSDHADGAEETSEDGFVWSDSDADDDRPDLGFEAEDSFMRSSSTSDDDPPVADDHDSGDADRDSIFSDLTDDIRRRRGSTAEGGSGDVDLEPDPDPIDRDLERQDLLDQYNDAKTEALLDLIRGASNILLRGPLGSPLDYEVCADMIENDRDEPINLLMIAVEESPRDRWNVCRGYLGETPAETVIVNVGDGPGSDAALSSEGEDPVTVTDISQASDLKRLGILLSKYLAEWESREGRTVVCFHSLTGLLDHVDLQTLFRFLHVFRGQIDRTNATAHYHLDATAHDSQVAGTLTPLFDIVLTFDEEEGVTVDYDRE